MPVEVVFRDVCYNCHVRTEAGQRFKLERGNFYDGKVVEPEIFHLAYERVADISADGADTLKTISKILKKYDATFLEIAGYTDAMSAAAADALSLDMAQRVGVYLSQHGINTARMFIVGRGATRPIAAQDDIGRLTNRRVEIRLVPAR